MRHVVLSKQPNNLMFKLMQKNMENKNRKIAEMKWKKASVFFSVLAKHVVCKQMIMKTCKYATITVLEREQQKKWNLYRKVKKYTAICVFRDTLKFCRGLQGKQSNEREKSAAVQLNLYVQWETFVI